jgi:hypothetical protein
MVQNDIFVSVVGSYHEQLSDPSKDCLLRLCNPLGEVYSDPFQTALRDRKQPKPG